MNSVSVQGSTTHDRIRSLCLLVGALLFLGLAGCATNPVTGDQNFVMFGEDAWVTFALLHTRAFQCGLIGFKELQSTVRFSIHTLHRQS